MVKNDFRIFGGEKMVAIDKMLEEKSKNILVEHHETKGDRIKPNQCRGKVKPMVSAVSQPSGGG